MVDPTTSNIALSVPVRGSNVGTWDTPNNGDLTIIDACFGGVTALALSSATPVPLTITQAQVNILRFTGTLTAHIVVTIPAIIKGWSVENLCIVGPYGVYLQNASGGQQIGIPPGETTDVYSDGTNIRYRNLGRVGSYLDIAAVATPAWILNSTVPPYLNCDGTTFSAITYPTLASILNGTTLPDLRGRTRAYMNGGTGRLTSAVGGVDGNTIFASGGSDGITLSQAQLPAATLTTTITDPGHTHANGDATLGGKSVSGTYTGGGGGNIGFPTYGAIQNASAVTGISATTALGGSGATHPNVQPTQISGICLIRAG